MKLKNSIIFIAIINILWSISFTAILFYEKGIYDFKMVILLCLLLVIILVIKDSIISITASLFISFVLLLIDISQVYMLLVLLVYVLLHLIKKIKYDELKKSLEIDDQLF